ncbi:hypothetical protein GGQ22_11300 [Nocardioides sp. zg-579]|uniref:Glycosyltransferase RgtA/B/C/D-like domain-containing protein n=1 Tax=Nocardioides marmotae TaxID=2663857 RepID=A0A6I3JBY6_9ACTN|nr:hypothetical protein [Nocardioides marmotae]MCR6032029.1 hypothetical protein [Gordonia jinghuaiqii]MTB95672.1 hypothetical protein [Nocardioides marmotae]QKE01080.1 hypothetical protein HPC71_08360 [Nocardioides marmotae]
MRAAMRRAARASDRPAPTGPHVVLAAAVAMVLAQLGFRAWAVAGGFFYGDDYQLVDEARAADGLSAGQVVEPYAAQFMPWGRFLAWLASTTESLSWPLLAATSLAVQALASAACVWMLVTLFGRRPLILVPLALYLSTAVTMPALMWWAAALNQLPVQAVFFAAVAAWVRYLRSRRLLWLGITLAILALGLCCYVKTLLVFPVLAFLALAFFARGGPVRRVVEVARTYWPAVLAGVLGGAAFLVYYLLEVPQISSDERPVGAGELAHRMIGDSFGTGVLGGPWHWTTDIAPVARATPPEWAVHLTWIVIALVVVGTVLRRERTLRVWLLLAAYVGADFVLLLTTRAQVVGSVSGTEYRYLTDAACAVVLCLGLATMELLDAPDSTRTRPEPLLTRVPGPRVVAAATALVAFSGLASSWAYAKVWHDQHPGKTMLGAAVEQLEGVASVDLADQGLASDVSGAFGPPYNSLEVLLPMLSPAARFPDSTERLHVLEEDGTVVPAQVEDTLAAEPGPVPGCGWRVREEGRTIPLEGPAIPVGWWLQIDYLASADSGLRVEAGGGTTIADVVRGLGTVFVKVLPEERFDTIRLEGLDPGVTLCVDTLVVGQPEPEEDA